MPPRGASHTRGAGRTMPAARSDPPWMEGAVKQVIHLLEQKPEGTQLDVHVWSDGTVSGPRDFDSRVGGLRLISVFTPGEDASPGAIRESLRRGIREAEQAARDETRHDQAEAAEQDRRFEMTKEVPHAG